MISARTVRGSGGIRLHALARIQPRRAWHPRERDRRGQDQIDLTGLGVTVNVAELADIDVAGRDAVITVGEDTIAFVGRQRPGVNAITQLDFII